MGRKQLNAAPKVVVIDDNGPNLELAKFLLEQGGFNVKGVGSADELMGVLPSFKPDILLMDIQLPGMDGITATRLIKQNPQTSHISIIAFTAYAMKGDAEKMKAAGCDGYISKPIEVTTFAQQVRSYLPPKHVL